MGQNYFNTLPLRLQLEELGQCRFMDSSEFNGVEALLGKKIVVVGCGAQGLHQGLNLRDSGLDVSYALREAAIQEKRQSWKNATDNGYDSTFTHRMVVKNKCYVRLEATSSAGGEEYMCLTNPIWFRPV